jgi:broad specificity phosphatase PhoE
MRRALQTYQNASQPDPSAPAIPAQTIVLEDLREQIGKHVCDKRSAISVIKKEFPNYTFNIKEDEDLLYTDVRETKEKMLARAKRVLMLLTRLAGKKVAIFSHSSFLYAMFLAYFKGKKELLSWLEPAEARVMTLYLPKVREREREKRREQGREWE